MRNIILVTFDSLRADHCSFMGYNRETTPMLDRMAKQGVYFEDAISAASRTNPSMTGVMTGEPLLKDGTKSTVDFVERHFKRNQTLAERLSEIGYSTGAICPNAYASRYYGFDKGFDMFEDFLFDSGPYQRIFNKYVSGNSQAFTMLRNLRNAVRREEVFKSWDKYIDKMESWAHNQSEPFFLWSFSLDTHFPYLSPKDHRKWGNLLDMYYYNWRCYQLLDKFDIDLSKKEKEKIINIYDDSIHFADAFLAEIQSRFKKFDPIIVIHSDHGEAIDEHGMYGHFFPSLYEENIRVPLVVWNSGISGESVSGPTSLLDLPNIILAVTDECEVADFPSNNWVVATDYDEHRDRNLTAIRSSDYKYVITEQGGSHSRDLYYIADGEDKQPRGEEVEQSKAMRKLCTRRVEHEKELLSIQGAAANSF